MVCDAAVVSVALTVLLCDNDLLVLGVGDQETVLEAVLSGELDFVSDASEVAVGVAVILAVRVLLPVGVKVRLEVDD
jgi:hypothetical protein